jgi:hypothetical protein
MHISLDVDAKITIMSLLLDYYKALRNSTDRLKKKTPFTRTGTKERKWIELRSLGKQFRVGDYMR